MQNRKRIVGAAGRRFDTDIGVTQEESEAMLSSLPKLPKASDIAKGVAKFGLYVAPISGEYYAAKDYKEYSKKYVDALSNMIEDESQLESWVQAKLTKASDYMSAVYHYLDYQNYKMEEK